MAQTSTARVARVARVRDFLFFFLSALLTVREAPGAPRRHSFRVFTVLLLVGECTDHFLGQLDLRLDR